MSQPNFPNSPQPGDTYTYSGSVWTWTGAYWRVLQGVAATGGSIVPAANVAYDLGSTNLRWRDLYLSGNSLILGGATLTATGSAIALPAGSTVGGQLVASGGDVATGGGPKITAVTVTNASYNNLDDTAVDIAGGYIKITGTGFVTGCSVIIGSVVATSVSFIGSTEVRAQVPAQAAGTYTVYLINPDGGVGIRVNGLNYSATPTWSTTSPLPSGLVDSAVSIQLAATSNTAVTFALQAGSTLPTGLTLTSGGLLSGTVTGITVDTTYNFTIVATDSELQDTPQAFSITITAVALDQYYNLVSLHLKGDVATGGNLTVFSDASTNNFQLTTNGDVRGSSFSPYGTSWSAYFDGTGDELETASAIVSSAEYSIEAWVYAVGNTQGYIAAQYTLGNGNRTVFLYRESTGVLYFFHPNQGSLSAGTLNLNTWYHVAITRDSGGRTRIFIDGILKATFATSYTPEASSFSIGGNGEADSNFHGYISNVRVLNGAIPVGYQTASTTIDAQIFTPPTAPLTAISGTSLLTCHTNRFIDRDGAAGTLAITRNGDTRISSFSPFLETDTTTGSGYFDGTGDYLDVTSSSFNPAGAFTVEFWFYPTDGTTQYQGLITSWPSGLSPAQGILIWKSGTSGNDSGVEIANPSTGGTIIGSFAWASCLNRWNHIVMVRNGSNSCAAFLNGNRLATPVTKSGAPGQTTLSVGRSFPNITNYYFQGYISNLHFVSGSSLYDPALTTISVPTVPITKVTDTALLTLQNRAAYNTIGFRDESEYQHIITRYGNAAQGTFSPFSPAGWSNYFNGSSSFNAGSLGTSIGTGDFSLEFFIYQTASAGIITALQLTMDDGNAIYLQTNSGAARFLSNSGIAIISGGTVNINTWNHLLATRQGSTVRLFVNGVLVASTTSSTSFTTPTSTYIGGATTLYLGSVRVCIGSVPTSYQTSSTTNGSFIFTSPTSLLTTSSQGATAANVKLLTCQSNRFVDISDSPKTLTISGSPTVAAFSPFKPVAYDPQVHGGSGYFDGSGDYLTADNLGIANFGTADFTVECWFYANDLANYRSIAESRVSNGTTTGWALAYDVNGAIYFYSNAMIVTSGSGAVILKQWNHVAVTRESGTNRLFLNGALIQSSTTSRNYTDNNFKIATRYDNTAEYFNGYISSMRVVKGTAVYTSAFTPPSGPLPLLGNTSLLLNFTNAGVIDSTGKNVIETVGNAGVVTTVKKYGSGSMYFDGTGDYLLAPSNALYSFGTGVFTVECWLYINSLPGVVGGIVDTATTINSGRFSLVLYSNGKIYVDNNTNLLISTSTLATGSWYHLAVVRTGTGTNQTSLYIDGVQDKTATIATDFTNNNLRVGVTFDNYNLNGYIDDLRITKGYARYVTGTDANVNKMVFNGTNTLALPTKALPDRGTLSTLTADLAAPSTIDYLVVAGGGGGGGGNATATGGGGAGGFRTGTALSVSSTGGPNSDGFYPITVGGGGPGGNNAAGTKGNDSIFSTITSTGGGYGGAAATQGGPGGSGGGTGGAGPSFGAGNTPSQPSAGGNGAPAVAYQGFNGGTSQGLTNGGGGGGASAAGGNGAPSQGGAGGAGQASTITGTSTPYAGGGGGGGDNRGVGGLGGGGDGGGYYAPSTAQPGTANTGGGGGARTLGGGSGGSGGSGVVILAYPTSFRPLKASLGLVYTIDTVTRPGYRVYRFTAGTGTISW